MSKHMTVNMDNDNGIKSIVDYEKLLAEAQEKHKEYKQEVDRYNHYWFNINASNIPEDILKKYTAAEDAWYLWLKENITNKGFRLDFDLSGRPIGLLKVLAVRRADYV